MVEAGGGANAEHEQCRKQVLRNRRRKPGEIRRVRRLLGSCRQRHIATYHEGMLACDASSDGQEIDAASRRRRGSVGGRNRQEKSSLSASQFSLAVDLERERAARFALAFRALQRC